MGEAAERNNARERWAVTPPFLRKSKAFSPIIMTVNAFHTLGKRICTNNGGAGIKCIPVYRPRHPFVFRVNVQVFTSIHLL